jgi:restriction system protein
MQSALQPLIKFIFIGLAVLSLVAAVVSAFQGLFRRSLLDRQSGLDSLRSLRWREFEQLVGEAYRRQGYDVEETGGGGADGGIDLVLRGHGETVLVQCKQWRERQVSVDKIRELFGVVTAEGADRGILVTSGNFTKDAQSFKVGKPLTLVDGPALTQLVRDVQPSRSPSVPAPPSVPAATPTCPRCGSPMVLRTAKRGASAGSSFYGCIKYPACKGTCPAS